MKPPKTTPRLDFTTYGSYRGSAVLDERGHVVGTTEEAERRLTGTRSCLNIEGEMIEFERSDGAVCLVGIWREHANCSAQLTHLRVADDDYGAFFDSLPARFRPPRRRAAAK